MSHPCDRVLVIDDDDDLLGAIRDALEDEGIVVASARTGEEAFRVLDEGFDPDVIVLDLLMPDMSGEQILQRLRGSERHAGIPVVLTTGTPGLFSRIRGADGLLPKPYDPETLYDVLAELC